MSQEGGPHPTTLAPRAWTSSLPHCEKDVSVVSKLPISGILLQQPEWTKTKMMRANSLQERAAMGHLQPPSSRQGRCCLVQGSGQGTALCTAHLWAQEWDRFPGFPVLAWGQGVCCFSLKGPQILSIHKVPAAPLTSFLNPEGLNFPAGSSWLESQCL